MIKKAVGFVFPVLLFTSSWVHERQAKIVSGWKKDIYRKAKIIFACIVVMVRKGRDFSLPCFIIPFKLGAWRREIE